MNPYDENGKLKPWSQRLEPGPVPGSSCVRLTDEEKKKMSMGDVYIPNTSEVFTEKRPWWHRWFDW